MAVLLNTQFGSQEINVGKWCFEKYRLPKTVVEVERLNVNVCTQSYSLTPVSKAKLENVHKVQTHAKRGEDDGK